MEKLLKLSHELREEVNHSCCQTRNGDTDKKVIWSMERKQESCYDFDDFPLLFLVQ